MESHPQASVVLYFCGYAAGLNGRPFLLPASANLRRASDAMTQGILAKALLDLVARGEPSRGLIAFDTAPTPDADGSSLGLESLAGLPAPEGVGVIAVTEPQPAQGPSPLSRALAGALGSPDVRIADLVAEVGGSLARSQTTHVAVALEPALSLPLAADEEPPAPAPPPPPPAPVEPEPEPAPPPAAAEPDPAPAEPPVSMPDEAEMTTDQRRSVQAALKRIGYYGAEVDGLFGPETRAAIRRFQHEIGAPTTGTITGEQASRLIDQN
jgi:hypothetical protein